MYIPPSFAETRPEVMLDFVEAHPLGALVTASADGLFATHMPFVLDRAAGPHGTLRGHVARANPHATRESLTAEGLVIFSGPEAYVSPAHYASKARHGKVVPTWNYVAVHAYGVVRFVDDAEFVLRNVEALTARHETARPAPWSVGDAPSDYVRAQLKAIVGVEVAIARLEGKWKMSQNRAPEDVEGVVAGLGASDDDRDRAVASIVDARRRDGARRE
jgi:transcriptional regulator